jgi:hypothetical protein
VKSWVYSLEEWCRIAGIMTANSYLNLCFSIFLVLMCLNTLVVAQNASLHQKKDKGLKICFQETEGSSQCQGTRSSCSGWSGSKTVEWTSPFRDDTDGRSGGCNYQWRLTGKPEPTKEYRICFQETEGSSQCQGIRSSCSGWSTLPTYTSPFR